MEYRNIENPFDGVPVEYVEETDSTMDDVANLLERGARHGTILVAGYQRRGRGRVSGRRWSCPPGAGLMYTLALDPGRLRTSAVGSDSGRGRSGALPLLAGLALHRTLGTHLDLHGRIKWPNDVLVRGRKIAGILAEQRGRYLLLGMGVNVALRSVPLELQDRATSIEQELREKPGGDDDPPAPTPPALLALLLAELRTVLNEPRWHSEIVTSLYGIGRACSLVLVPDSGQAVRTVNGTVEGVAADGAIMIRERESGRVKTYPGGELHVVDN